MYKTMRSTEFSKVINSGRNICEFPSQPLCLLCALFCFIFHTNCCLITITFLKPLHIFSLSISSNVIIVVESWLNIKDTLKCLSHTSRPFPPFCVYSATLNFLVFSKYNMLFIPSFVFFYEWGGAVRR